MATPKPKYVARTEFSIGRHYFKAGDPIPGSVVFDTILKLGFAVPAKSGSDKTPDKPPADPATTKE